MTRLDLRVEQVDRFPTTMPEALAPIEGPVSYLDSETIISAVPVWHGCAPYEQVPVQYSLHIGRGGALAHHAWLTQAGAGPPRRRISEVSADSE